MGNTAREIINLDGVSVEKICDTIYIARIHSAGISYGGEWNASMVLIKRGEMCEIIAGVSGGEINMSRMRKIFKFLNSIGVSKIEFDRIVDGRVIKHRLKI